MAHRLRTLACTLLASFLGAISHAAPFAYIPHDDGVAVIDVNTHGLVTQVRTLAPPRDIAAKPGSTRAYAVGSPIEAIEVSTQQPTIRIESPSAVFMALSPASPAAFILEQTCLEAPPCPPGPTTYRVRVIDTESRGGLGSFFLTDLRAAVVDSIGAHAYFSEFGAGVVHMRNARTFDELGIIAVGGGPWGLAVHPDATRVYVARSLAASVAVIDPSTETVVATIPVGAAPRFLVPSPSGHRLYVANTGDNSVSVIDTATNAVIATIPVGASPTGIDVTPSGEFLYVVTSGGVSVFSTANHAGVASVAVGTNAHASGRFFAGSSATPAITLPGVLTGLFWNPNESGWGMHLTQRGNNVFAAWFTYGTEGAPRWYTASACRFVTELPCPSCVSGAICEGGVTESRGPYILSDVFNPALVTRGQVGTFRMRFHGPDAATLTYDVNGFLRTVEIQRQMFGVGPAPGTNYSDLWWNPNESGWGMGITQQGNLMFLTWFVYDRNREPVWYIASRCEVVATGNGCRGRLYRTSGPIGPHGPNGFDAARVRIEDAGLIEASFGDANNGTISYIFEGTPASKSITRQVF